MGWSPSSWATKRLYQIPNYEDLEKLERVKNKLRRSKPIVSASEIQDLRARLVEIEKGNGFFIQGGDCAESFDDFSEQGVIDLCNLLARAKDMVGIENTILIGRIAGQFAKPRSNEFEGDVLSYRGDIINGINDRSPNPERMLVAHQRSLKTARLLNGVFTSHDALLMHYEECLVRDGNVLTSTHLPWIGVRTAHRDGAQVEFLSGIRNPIAIKIEAGKAVDEILDIIKKLNPKNESGKIILILRMGVGNSEKYLPELIGAVRDAGLNIIWACDPMHGNTKILNGQKVRYLDDIIQEFREFREVCKEEGVHVGGIHLEMTAADVVECLGNREGQFCDKYKTLCDPRLNREQVVKFFSKIFI